jgi:hypothetical protein
LAERDLHPQLLVGDDLVDVEPGVAAAQRQRGGLAGERGQRAQLRPGHRAQVGAGQVGPAERDGGVAERVPPGRRVDGDQVAAAQRGEDAVHRRLGQPEGGGDLGDAEVGAAAAAEVEQDVHGALDRGDRPGLAVGVLGTDCGAARHVALPAWLDSRQSRSHHSTKGNSA